METWWLELVLFLVVYVQCEAEKTTTEPPERATMNPLERATMSTLYLMIGSMVVCQLVAFIILGFLVHTESKSTKKAQELISQLSKMREEIDETRMRYWGLLREERLYVQRNHEYEILCRDNRVRAQRVIDEVKAEIKQMRKEGERGAARLNRLPYYEQELEQLKRDAQEARARAWRVMDQTMQEAGQQRKHEEAEGVKRAQRAHDAHQQQMASRQSYFQRAVRPQPKDQAEPFDDEAVLGTMPTVMLRKKSEVVKQDETRDTFDENDETSEAKTRIKTKSEAEQSSAKIQAPLRDDH